MAAEVLFERTVLSVVVTPMGGGGAIDGGSGGTAILTSWQATTTYTEQGVAGALAPGFNATSVKTQSCEPAAILSS